VFRLETIMRFSSVAIAAALATVSIATALQGQRPDDQIDPRSLQWLAQGRAQRAAGNLDAATDTLETAVAIDPRNRGAFITLAEVASQRDLPGKAIRLYREALLLEPADRIALKGQGEALIAKGAIVRAKENLTKLRALCKGNCPEATSLAATIAKGPPVTTAQVESKPAAKVTAANP
jgi:Tfp pilus assembly protein PilF